MGDSTSSAHRRDRPRGNEACPLGFGGLPLTGGALAKLAVKPPLGEGVVGLLATLAAVGSTLLMLHFLYRLRSCAPSEPEAVAPPGLTWPWLTTAFAAIAVPGRFSSRPGSVLWRMR
jgi:hypothetical protein